MTDTEFYNCTTITMGKHLDYNDPKFEIEDAKAFVKAFALWFELESYDEKKRWFTIKISYVNDNFSTRISCVQSSFSCNFMITSIFPLSMNVGQFMKMTIWYRRKLYLCIWGRLCNNEFAPVLQLTECLHVHHP